MRPIYATQTGVGATPPQPLDTFSTPFNVTVAMVLSGAATYSLQYTLDNVLLPGYNPATGNWFPHPDATAITTTNVVNFAFPVTAFRVVITSGSGAVNLTAIQAGQSGV